MQHLSFKAYRRKTGLSSGEADHDRLRSWWVWLTLILSIGSYQVQADTSVRKLPNIVMIISDDQAWTDYGFMGHPHIQTPNLDRLAQQSALFLRGYVPSALCRPSLASIITGLYPHQHGIIGNDPSPRLATPNSAEYNTLRQRMIDRITTVPTLPRLLSQQGYWSFQSGKWWEGNYQLGGFTHGMTRGFPHPGGRHGDEGLKIGREGLDPIFHFIDQAVSAQKPFFLWYAPMMPHTPHDPPERLLSKYRDRVSSLHVARYYAMCEWFDETCGALLQGLEYRGLMQDTLVVYTGDNGWLQDPEKPNFLPRSKQSPHEAGVRQPIMLCWRNVIPPGRHDELVTSLDLAPSILAAAQIEPPSELSGINLLPCLLEKQPWPQRLIYGETFAHDVANLDDHEDSLLFRWVIDGRWKLILTYDGDAGRHQALHRRDDSRPQLYDLSTDPHETHNLAAVQPEIVSRLAASLERWWPVKRRKTLIEWRSF